MPPLRIAAQLKNIPLPFAKALAKVRELGIRAVEIDARGSIRPETLTGTALREVRKRLEDHELRVAAVEFHTRRGYGHAEDLDRRVEATKAAMRMARSLGADLVVNQVGQVPEDLQSKEGVLLVDVLRDLGLYAHHAGAWLSAETGSESGAELRRLLDALPPHSLPVTLNPGNLILNGFSAQEAVDVLGETVRYVHAKDAVRDLGRRRGLEVTLGRGSVDWPSLLGALEEHGFRGYLTIAREDADDPLVEIADAAQYLASL